MRKIRIYAMRPAKLHQKEAETNANLIAAAPQLLEVLEESLPFLKRFAEHCEEQFGIVALDLGGKIIKAEAVIAKAKGRK